MTMKINKSCVLLAMAGLAMIGSIICIVLAFMGKRDYLPAALGFSAVANFTTVYLNHKKAAKKEEKISLSEQQNNETT